MRNFIILTTQQNYQSCIVTKMTERFFLLRFSWIGILKLVGSRFVAEMKMAEAKRQAEKKLKREQRMMKMMQQQQQQEQLEATDQQQLGGGGSEEPPQAGQESIRAKRILETIQDEEEAEARVLQVIPRKRPSFVGQSLYCWNISIVIHTGFSSRFFFNTC